MLVEDVENETADYKPRHGEDIPRNLRRCYPKHFFLCAKVPAIYQSYGEHALQDTPLETSVLSPPHTSRCFVGRQKIFTCRLVCGGPRQFLGARAYLNQWGIVIRVTWTSVFSNMAEIDSVPSLNAVSRDKKSASVRQAVVPTNFNPIWPR